MLIVHHLALSQSERAHWTCEELGVPYTFVRHERDPQTRAAPKAVKAMHTLGTAPVIQDGDLTLPESAAIVEYICRKYGDGRLLVDASAPHFADFLYWFHFANGSFMPASVLAFFAAAAASGKEMTERDRLRYQRKNVCFEMVEQRLGEAPYFAGPEFTAADIMMMFPLSTMRYVLPHDISGSPNLLAYLARIGARPAYQRAMAKGDPDLAPKLT